MKKKLLLVLTLAGIMIFSTGCGAGGMSPEDVVTLPFKAEEGEAAPEATVKDLNIRTIGLNENIADDVTVGDSWFAFAPESDGYYCFYAAMDKSFDAEYFNIHVFEKKIGEKNYIFGGALSDGLEDGTYRFYFTMDGMLKAGKTYYMCFSSAKDFDATDIHLTEGDAEVFAGFGL